MSDTTYNKEMQPFYYCYFSFRNGIDEKHELRIRVTPSLCLEWHLYINDAEVGSYWDEVTNVLIEDRLANALSYNNVKRMYSELLTAHLNK